MSRLRHLSEPTFCFFSIFSLPSHRNLQNCLGLRSPRHIPPTPHSVCTSKLKGILESVRPRLHFSVWVPRTNRVWPSWRLIGPRSPLCPDKKEGAGGGLRGSRCALRRLLIMGVQGRGGVAPVPLGVSGQHAPPRRSRGTRLPVGVGRPWVPGDASRRGARQGRRGSGAVRTTRASLRAARGPRSGWGRAARARRWARGALPAGMSSPQSRRG